ncbi:MAG TPA: M20/M25/M40 family metallo-hydrolase [Candidatus Acidoferrales bacterium]|nr:M20/M25/M40 family metallo-hydrolase [Candidatus Acidoferrales bacterium]
MTGRVPRPGTMPWRQETVRTFLWFGAVAALVASHALFSAPLASAQAAPINPPPGWKQVPSGPGTCSVGKSCADLAPGMIQSALGPSPLKENLRYLTDTIGGRLTGSPAADRAAGWAVEALRRAGVDEVHTEKFTVPVGWSEGQTHFEVLAPVPFPVRLVSIGWSPPTPAGGITADVVDAGAGDAAGFAKASGATQGAIVLVHSKILVTWDDLNREYKTDAAIIARATKARAAAIFWMSTRPNLLLYRHTEVIDGHLEPLPQAVVAREDAERMARFLASGQKVRVHFEMPNHVGGPVESQNVVGEIRGREKPDEFVLLGAHIDSWDLGTGALDNGSAVAMVIDAVRVIRASGNVPRRSIRFVLFTGEEQVMLGSWAYARAHRAELDRMIAAIVFDGGTGAVTGYSLGGRNDALSAVRDTLAPLAPLGVKDFTLDASIDTDRYDFMVEGVLTLDPNQEPANYMLNYHATSDTFDKVDIAELKKQTAIAAITAYALADREERIASRQSRPQIGQLLKETGLEEEMKIEGFWPSWESGDRGRQP